MKFYIDIATRRFVRGPASSIPLDRTFFKRRDKIDIEIVFVEKSAIVPTPPKILAQRGATCRACDQWDAAALNATGRCRKCGCSTWAKLRMATEACPLGKWQAVLTTEHTENTEIQKSQA